jgi:hypothetical protein
MSKPKVRILHNLARSGGTLIGKCLGCMSTVVLLSEIHPVGAQLFPQLNNPLLQAFQWHNISTPKDLEGGTLTFTKAIGIIEKKCSDKEKKLVLRDWSHFDFIGLPFVDTPSYKLLLADILAADFEVVHFALVRHPIDQWLSMIKTFPILESIPLDAYLNGYLEYSRQIQACGFVRYEDIAKDPEKHMEIICDKLQLEFDRNFLAHWSGYNKITGDTDRAISRGAGLNTIVLLPRRRIEDALLTRFRRNKKYMEAVELLNYGDA